MYLKICAVLIVLMQISISIAFAVDDKKNSATGGPSAGDARRAGGLRAGFQRNSAATLFPTRFACCRACKNIANNSGGCALKSWRTTVNKSRVRRSPCFQAL